MKAGSYLLSLLISSVFLIGITVPLYAADSTKHIPLYIPMLTGGLQASVNITNLQDRPVAVKVTAYSGRISSFSFIQLASGETKTINPNSLPAGTVFLKLQPSGGIAANAAFRTRDNRKSEVITALDTTDVLDFPVLVSGDAFFKKIVLFNPKRRPALISISAVNKDGYEIGRLGLGPISPKESREVKLRDIFQNSILSETANIRVVSAPKIVGLQMVDFPEADIMGLIAPSGASRAWMFPVINMVEDIELLSGVGLLNTSDTEATVNIEAFDEADNSLGLIDSVSLQPLAVHFLLTSNMQGGIIPANAFYLKAFSEPPIFGYEAFGAVGRGGLAGAMAIAEEDAFLAGYEITGSKDGGALNAYPLVRTAEGSVKSTTGSLISFEWRIEKNDAPHRRAPKTAKNNNPSKITARIFSKAEATSPVITVTSPNGGELWPAGSRQKIAWSVVGDASKIKYFRITYSVDGGESWKNIGTAPASARSMTWRIPLGLSSALVKIRVRGIDSKTYITASDRSDETFGIASDKPAAPSAPKPKVTVVSPNGGELWASGSKHDITWSLRGNGSEVSYFWAAISTDGGANWKNIRMAKATSHSLKWSVPESFSASRALIRIRALDSNGYILGSDKSDESFSIGDSLREQKNQKRKWFLFF